PIFLLSRIAAESFAKKQSCKIHMDFMPDHSKEDLVAMIYERIGQGNHKNIEELFVGWLNKRAIMAIIKQADVGSPLAPCENLEYEMVEALAQSMKQLIFEVHGTRGFKFAQATVGGITLDEVNLETMESLKVQGLYLTGEVLDVDGDCGGYNLQWAWSTGFVAGEAATL
ncbi:MAG: NAD(P)/FAD-dependent oxidoreductase, partial [Niameybacter sp.]